MWQIKVKVLGHKRKISQVVEASDEDEAKEIAIQIASGRGFSEDKILDIKVTKLTPPSYIEL
jgi:hypothetical protein